MTIWNKELVSALHQVMRQASGGSEGLRDEGLLCSAIGSAYATFGGVELYPTVEEKAARLGFALASNHPFVDGNKRIGVLAMLMTLKCNGINLRYTQPELIALGLAVAAGNASYGDILDWIRVHHT